MEPPTGGVSYESAKISLEYSYFENDGAKFISFPTHHTRYVAIQEKRKSDYIHKCFYVPDEGPTYETTKILELIAKKNVVLNTGHLSPKETLILVKAAKNLGVEKILVPSNNFDKTTIEKLKIHNVYFEFSYFFVSEATEVPLTHIDDERHKIKGLTLKTLKDLIEAADPKNVILSSDCGVSILPKPHLGFYQFIKQVHELGFTIEEIDYMIKTNSKRLFRI